MYLLYFLTHYKKLKVVEQILTLKLCISCKAGSWYFTKPACNNLKVLCFNIYLKITCYHIKKYIFRLCKIGSLVDDPVNCVFLIHSQRQRYIAFNLDWQIWFHNVTVPI